MRSSRVSFSGFSLSNADTLEIITGGTVNGEEVPFFDGDTVGSYGAIFSVNADFASTNNTRNTKLASNYSSMGGRATFTGENTFGCEHTMNIVWFGERTNHDNVLTFFFGHSFSRPVSFDMLSRFSPCH